jgi:hypothetical protein
MQPIEISFTVEASISPCDFLLQCTIDDKLLWSSNNLGSAETVTVVLEDTQAHHAHCIRFEMQGKQSHHTEIDDDGNIVNDHTIIIRDFRVEGVLMQHFLQSHAVYDHDFNGSSDAICDEFYGIMGCNGTVSMSFSTPIFLWLLENA